MTTAQAVKLLLDCVNSRGQLPASGFGVFEGTTGNVPMFQRELNAAITTWRETRNAAKLRQFTQMLKAYGNLTDTEYQQIMKALDGEQHNGTEHN